MAWKKGLTFCSQAPLVGIPPSSAYEKTALCLIRAVISVGWQSIFGCFIVYPFVHRRNRKLILNGMDTDIYINDVCKDIVKYRIETFIEGYLIKNGLCTNDD